jgi:dienelactone hydrolase
MAEIYLFHSALGLRPGVVEAAERLRRAGHYVHAPDLYDGDIFDDLEEGVRKRDELGIPEIIRRAVAASERATENAIYAGFSLGAGCAEFLAATRLARGAVLMSGAAPLSWIGIEEWPAHVPVQIHSMEDDPWINADAIQAVARAVRATGEAAEVYTYPGGRHLFADPGLPDYEPNAAGLMWQRVLTFIARREVRVANGSGRT